MFWGIVGVLQEAICAYSRYLTGQLMWFWLYIRLFTQLGWPIALISFYPVCLLVRQIFFLFFLTTHSFPSLPFPTLPFLSNPFPLVFYVLFCAVLSVCEWCALLLFVFVLWQIFILYIYIYIYMYYMYICICIYKKWGYPQDAADKSLKYVPDSFWSTS